MPEPLSLDQVRHVARLARLRLSDAELETYRAQLAEVIAHLDTIAELDVEGIEPMAHPLDVTNRLDDDEPRPTMPLDDLHRNAPAVEDRYLAVPKVLGDEADATSA
jgi:aspartyl-tRNA(Asn)/glutamyl-tRNA(Gln) amidotransferase subunit C